MSKRFEINPRTDFVIERFIDAPRHLVWEALTRPEHLKEWYVPKPLAAVSNCEMDVRPGGILSIDIATGDGQERSTGMKPTSRKTKRPAGSGGPRSPSIIE